ncbi:ATP-binding cassette domain-containing protein [Geobacillus icigianus]|nr:MULTISPECIES: ATP-binding cassette domain-containing protein [Geobacillus]
MKREAVIVSAVRTAIARQGGALATLPAHVYGAEVIKEAMRRADIGPELVDDVIIGHRLCTSSNVVDAILRTKRHRREEQAGKEKAMAMLDFVGLTDMADRLVDNLSQEQKKRVAFALALATDPELVLLDEPAAGVNLDETEGLGELIVKMVQGGLIVCLIEHKMSMIMKIADRIMVHNYGEKIAEGTPKEVQNNEAVIQAYLGGSAVA